ncbi:MAG: GNAT family N-acetyltransferase [Gammaproteobacteria bacterium]
MQLTPLENNGLLDMAARWLGEQRNYKWLDFGGDIQRLDKLAVKVMARKENHVLRAFTADDDIPIGIVGLSDVHHDFKTATLWIVLGERLYSNKGYAVKASSAMLELGFAQLGLHSINVWAVETNYPSLRAIKRLNFRPAGRQRECHYIDGVAHDRLWFDMLENEYYELRENTHA